MPFLEGAVAHIENYKRGAYFSRDFLGESSWNGYENNCLFANLGGGDFADVARPAGADNPRDSRGFAAADFDGDGRLDLVASNNDAAPTVYLSRVEPAGHWLRLELEGRRANRDAVGARLRFTVGGRTLTRFVEAGSGYASQHPLAVHVGLGDATRVDAAVVVWPDGEVQDLGVLEPVDRTVRIVQASS